MWGLRATGIASSKDLCRSLYYFAVPSGQCSIGTVIMSNTRSAFVATTDSITDFYRDVKPLSTDCQSNTGSAIAGSTICANTYQTDRHQMRVPAKRKPE